MYLPNITFADRGTLIEMLFEFESGSLSDYTRPLIDAMYEELESDPDFMAIDEDDEEEGSAYVDEKLADHLMAAFKTFAVEDKKLYGINEAGKTLLMEMR